MATRPTPRSSTNGRRRDEDESVVISAILSAAVAVAFVAVVSPIVKYAAEITGMGGISLIWPLVIAGTLAAAGSVLRS